MIPSDLHCVAMRCSVLSCVAVCCSVLQCVAVCCSVLQHLRYIMIPSQLQCVEYVAACCSVSQCAAMRCSALQHIQSDGNLVVSPPCAPRKKFNDSIVPTGSTHTFAQPPGWGDDEVYSWTIGRPAQDYVRLQRHRGEKSLPLRREKSRSPQEEPANAVPSAGLGNVGTSHEQPGRLCRTKHANPG